MTTDTTTSTHQIHPKTGRPIQVADTFEVGDLVTEHMVGDGYPGVVVSVTPKRVWVQRVRYIGNFSDQDAPGYNGYGDSGTIAIDPQSVEEALALGQIDATQYTLYVTPRPTASASMAALEAHGGPFHRAFWRRPGASYATLSKGARYRRDPHV